MRFEDLIGKVVHNSRGRPVGKIEDARMEPEEEDYLITHFLIGPLGRLTRLRAFLGELPTFRALGIGKTRSHRPLPWNWFDLSDPDHPVLTVSEGSPGE
jgi:hypothetical protein